MSDKTLEHELRRKAARQGLALRKSRPDGDHAAYWLVSATSGGPVTDREWGWSLEDIGAVLQSAEERCPAAKLAAPGDLIAREMRDIQHHMNARARPSLTS